MKVRDPITRRWVSEATAIDRVALWQAAAEDRADEIDYAGYRYDQAVSVRSQRYWRKRLNNAVASLDYWENAITDVRRQLEPVRRRRKPKPEPDVDDLAMEWEFGLDYGMARKKPLNINVRLVFDEPVTEHQARRALRQYVDGEDPTADVFVDGIRARVRAVDWQTDGKRRQRGEPEDLENFRAILYTEGVEKLRAGAVKPNRL